MHPKLPPEILIFIIDDVAEISPSHNETIASLMALLRTSTHFRRCRRHIYRTIHLRLESCLLNTAEKTLDMFSLRFLDLLRSMPDIGGLVKELTIDPGFDQSSTAFVITETPAWRLLAEINAYLSNVESVNLYFDLYPEIKEPMTINEQLAPALPMILPSCPFRKLTIESVSVQPAYLMKFLAHVPQISTLDITEATFYAHPGPEPQHDMIMDAHPKIHELILSDSNDVLVKCWENDAFRAVIVPSSVRRLVMPALDMTILDAEGLELWPILGEFLSRLTGLQELFLDLSDTGGPEDPDPRALVYAPSLCIGINDAQTLVGCSNAWVSAGLSLFPSDIKLQRLAIVIHRRDHSACWDADVWRKLASALVQPRLQTVCITFHEWGDEIDQEGDVPFGEVPLFFKDCRAKVIVQTKIAERGGDFPDYFDTMF